MAYSGLVSGIIPSQYFSLVVNKKVDSVAIHTMAGNMSAENCGYWFQTELVDERDSKGNKTGKKVPLNASSNYGIGSDGTIYGYVDEIDYAWCTSSSGVDTRAVSIEVASLTNSEPYECSPEAYNALINLLVDICQRHNMYLRWADSKSYAEAAANGGPVTEQNMFLHKWFAAKSCPGQYLYERQGQIADEVNSRLRKSGRRIPAIEYKNAYITGKSTCIFIGDSRTVGMRYYVDSKSENHIWSCAGGMGIAWMRSKGSPDIESKVNSDTAVCILMGINDITKDNISWMSENYSSYINECADRWVARGATVYFVSVNPVVEGGYGGNLLNSDIETFNQSVRNGLNARVGYIDTYSLLIDNFETFDGLHYTATTYNDIYNIIVSTVRGGKTTKYHNSAMIGGVDIDVDYTKLNPYVITLDRYSPDKLDFDKIQENGVVGAVIEYGALYDKYHTKYQKFKQPKFESQLKQVDESNLEYGYMVTTRARTLEEARSEIQEFIPILRSRPPRLGVWLKLEFDSRVPVSVNDKIIMEYQNTLIQLGFKRKLGLYTSKESIDNFTWDDFQSEWILWLDKHVEETSDLEQLLTPAFFRLHSDDDEIPED